MGCYDFINGMQIKCFYLPIFYKEDENYAVFHSGGTLQFFEEGDEVPTQTMYYKYPNNFIIYNYRSIAPAHLIKDGKVVCTKNIELFTKSDWENVEVVIDYYGNLINVHSTQDCLDLFNDFKAYQAIEQPILNNGLEMLNRIKKATELEKESLWEEYHKNNEIRKKKQEEAAEKYLKKWILKDPYKNEKKLGEALDCLMDTYNEKDYKPSSYVRETPTERYLACKSYVKDILKNNPGIIERYMQWVEVDKEKAEDIMFLLDLVTC